MTWFAEQAFHIRAAVLKRLFYIVGAAARSQSWPGEHPDNFRISAGRAPILVYAAATTACYRGIQNKTQAIMLKPRDRAPGA